MPNSNFYTFRGISFRLLFCSYWTADATAPAACLFLLGEARQRSVCADFVLANVCVRLCVILYLCVSKYLYVHTRANLNLCKNKQLKEAAHEALAATH